MAGLALLVLVWRGQAMAARADDRWVMLAPGLFVSRDSEDFNISKTAVGLLPLYQDGNHYTALKLAGHRYSTADWAVEGTQLTLARTAIHAGTGLGYQASVGLSSLEGRQLVTADMDYSHALGETTQAGYFFQRDWVETRNALSQGLSYDFIGASLEHRLAPGWTAIGVLAQHRFSDDNIRTHARVRLIYDVLPQQGVNVQLRHRHFWSSNPPNANYFNPDVYGENMLALGLRRRLAGWVWSGTLGAGLQKVSADQEASTHLAELEATSPLAGQIFFKAKLGYSDGIAFNGPNYIYRYLQAELIFKF
jgi:hypothetical protein